MYGRLSSNLLKGSLADLAGRLRQGRAGARAVRATTPPTACRPTPRRSPRAPRPPARVAQPRGRAAPGAGGVRLAGRRARLRPAAGPRVRHRRAAGEEAAGAATPTTSGCRSSGASRTTRSTRRSGRSRTPRRAGRYRFVVTGNRYRLESEAFRVARSDRLSVLRLPGSPVRVRLAYPSGDDDLTWRPAFARGGRVTFRVNGARRRVRSRGTTFTIRAPAVGVGDGRPRRRPRPVRQHQRRRAAGRARRLEPAARPSRRRRPCPTGRGPAPPARPASRGSARTRPGPAPTSAG